MDRRRPRSLILAAAVSACIALALSACSGDRAGGRHATNTTGTLPPPAQLNEQTAAAKLRAAEEAERAGQFDRAREAYEQLRSYPEESRPKDLDARMRRLDERSKASS